MHKAEEIRQGNKYEGSFFTGTKYLKKSLVRLTFIIKF